jgi:hypothetical protein
MKTVGCLFLTLLLAGCASMSQQQCRQGDWQGLGLADGRAGEPLERMEQHRRACAEYAVVLDERQYREGRSQGLREYCRWDNAFTTGLEGRRYQHVCPPAIDATFEHYNRSAYEISLIKKELTDLHNQRARIEHRLYDPGLADAGRAGLRFDLRELDRRYDQLRDDLRSSERYLDHLREEARTRSLPD